MLVLGAECRSYLLVDLAPLTVSSSERVNQVPEQYCLYLYNQDNWSNFLGQASFAYNTSKHTATKLSSFYANFGYCHDSVSAFDQEGPIT